jgi:hypothetical protein
MITNPIPASEWRLLQQNFSRSLNLITNVVCQGTQLVDENTNHGGRNMLTGPQEQLFTRSRSVVSRTVAGETLIVPVRGKVGDLASIYSFNHTGSLIWQLLDSPRTLTELVDAVEREYEVTRQQAQEDVTRFLQDMLSVELLNLQPAMAAAESALNAIDMAATESNRRAALETATSN